MGHFVLFKEQKGRGEDFPRFRVHLRLLDVFVFLILAALLRGCRDFQGRGCMRARPGGGRGYSVAFAVFGCAGPKAQRFLSAYTWFAGSGTTFYSAN